MSAKRWFTVKVVIGRFLFNPKEWKIDRETSFYYRLVNRETGMKKWVRKEYFHAEERNYPYRPCKRDADC